MFPILDLAIVGMGLLASGLHVAQEYERGVVFKLGRYHGLRGPGLYGSFPWLSSARSRFGNDTYRQGA
jgi:regulator of protease activity HflC (stomatin/prohibitin superfamily)